MTHRLIQRPSIHHLPCWLTLPAFLIFHFPIFHCYLHPGGFIHLLARHRLFHIPSLHFRSRSLRHSAVALRFQLPHLYLLQSVRQLVLLIVVEVAIVPLIIEGAVIAHTSAVIVLLQSIHHHAVEVEVEVVVVNTDVLVLLDPVVSSHLSIISILLLLIVLFVLSTPPSSISFHHLHMRLGVVFSYLNLATFLHAAVRHYHPFLLILRPGQKLPTFFSKSEMIIIQSLVPVIKHTKRLSESVSRNGIALRFGGGTHCGGKRLPDSSFLFLL